MSVSNINTYCFHRMNTERNVGQRRRVEVVGNNQVLPQVPAEGVLISVNKAGLTDVKVRAYLS